MYYCMFDCTSLGVIDGCLLVEPPELVPDIHFAIYTAELS